MIRRDLPPGDRTLSPLGVVRRFGRDPLEFLQDQFERYGDLATMQGPFYRPHILINDPDLTHQVLVSQAAHFQKPPALKRLFTSTYRLDYQRDAPFIPAGLEYSSRGAGPR